MTARQNGGRPRTHAALLSDLTGVIQQHQDHQKAPPCDPVGSRDIAERLGIQANTVHAWVKREVMPAPRWTISGNPVWDWNADVIPWLRATGRWQQ